MDNCTCDLYNDHILNNPKVLPCGFSACLKCLQKLLDKSGKLECTCCNQVHMISEPDKLISNVKIANMIKNNLKIFTTELVDKLQRIVMSLQNTHSNSESLMNNFFALMKEEVAIRIESVKVELDKLGEQLYKLIDEKNRKMKFQIEKMNAKIKENSQNSQKFISSIHNILNRAESNTERLEENLYLCQDRLKELNNIDAEYYNIFNTIKFKPNETELSASIIGELHDDDFLPTYSINVPTMNTLESKINTTFQHAQQQQPQLLQNIQYVQTVQSSNLLDNSELQNSDVFEAPLENDSSSSLNKTTPNEFKTVDMTKKVEWPCGILNIGDKDLIMTDNVNNEIIVLNSELQIVKHIKSIGDVTFSSPFGIASDEKDTVYVCDGGNHRVIVLNKSFSRVKKIIGKKGKLNGEFNFPLGVCFFNGLLYVTDHDNRRVQIFTQNGDFTKEIRLLRNPSKKNLFVKDQDLINSPWCLAVVTDTIAVLDFCENIYIYNFDGQLRYIIQDSSINSICIVDGYLYTHGNNGSFSCYEKSKKKYEQHQYELVYRHTYDNLKAYSAFMTHFNNNLIITFGEKKFVAIVSKNNKTK